MQLRWSGHLVPMDDERLPKRLSYGDVATAKTGAAIYEANRIAATKVKREARKSQLRPPRNADAQPLPTCARCQRTFRARIGLIGHLRVNCTPRNAPTVVPPPASSSSSPPPTISVYSSEPPPPSSSYYSSSSSSFFSPSSSSSTAPTTPCLVAVTHINTTHIADTTTYTPHKTSDSRGEDQDYTCPHCYRTFTSHIGLVGHLRIYRTETGEPVPGAPTYTHHARLNCPHCPPTFTYRMGLFGHMRIHKSEIDRSPDSSTTPNPTLTSLPCAPITTTIASSVAETDTADYSCSHCPRTFASHIGLVSHLRIHRTETGEPVPGAPSYTHRTRLHCPHCPRTFTHRMGLFGHMRIQEHLR
ncbi:hypothetical protein SprV_0401669300 [Sparganum proliferum]